MLAAAVAGVAAFVDPTPAVERDDPQLEEDERIREMFPAPPQIIVSADDGDFSEEYLAHLRELSTELRELEGVQAALDVLSGPEDLEQAFENPLWQRLLVSEDGRSTDVIVLLGTDEFDRVVPAIEEVVDVHRAPPSPSRSRASPSSWSRSAA